MQKVCMGASDVENGLGKARLEWTQTSFEEIAVISAEDGIGLVQN